MLGEALEMVRTSKRDDGDLCFQVLYLPVVFPLLREVLLAVSQPR